MKHDTPTQMIDLKANEAWVAEFGLRTDEAWEDRELFLQLGCCIVSDGHYHPKLTQRQLWDLHEHIKPASAMGQSSGIEALTKVYRALLEINHKTIPASRGIEFKEVPRDSKIMVVDNDGKEGSPREDACQGAR